MSSNLTQTNHNHFPLRYKKKKNRVNLLHLIYLLPGAALNTNKQTTQGQPGSDGQRGARAAGEGVAGGGAEGAVRGRREFRAGDDEPADLRQEPALAGGGKDQSHRSAEGTGLCV